MMDIMFYLKAVFSVMLSLFALIGSVSFPCPRQYHVPTGVLEAAEPAEEAPEAEDTVFVSVTDRLRMPLLTHTAEADVITADLNAEVINGISPQSHQAAAFSRVFDRVIVFRAGENVRTAYVLGAPVDIENCIVQKETGYYLSLSVAADVFGCDRSEAAGKTAAPPRRPISSTTTAT